MQNTQRRISNSTTGLSVDKSVIFEVVSIKDHRFYIHSLLGTMISEEGNENALI